MRLKSYNGVFERGLNMPLGADIVESNDRWGFEFRVSLPVIVVEVNEDQSLVRVKVAVKDRTMGRSDRLVEYFDHQEIPDVPVAHYSTSKGYIISKIEPETHGKIVFCDFDISRYVNEGEVLDLASSRFHDWNDCYFTVGEFSYARRIDPVDADIAIAAIDGRAGFSIQGGIVEIFGDAIIMNGLPITTVNPGPPASFQVLPGTPKPAKEVRR